MDYIVLEAGTHILDDGTALSAGTFPSIAMYNRNSSRWVHRFPSPFSSTPLVWTQVQTFQYPSYMVTRIKSRSKTMFTGGMQKQEKENDITIPPSKAETIGWLAMELKADIRGTKGYYATGYAKDVAATCWKYNKVSYGSAFSRISSPVLIAKMDGVNGHDPAALRTKKSAYGFEVCVQEDTTQDNETRHVLESVSWLVRAGPGLLVGSKPTNNTDPVLTDPKENHIEDSESSKGANDIVVIASMGTTIGILFVAVSALSIYVYLRRVVGKTGMHLLSSHEEGDSQVEMCGSCAQPPAV
mmetsp:Transcript_14852/g.30134  ORF Transcript_14852/g.30134 Transcript_14852/m.30134 type:complete len:299 (+) Transcript_14852:691-1587(+)